MKKLLLALVPLAFLAAAVGESHQAFGPIRFGMQAHVFATAAVRLQSELHSTKWSDFTAATARKYFVGSNSRFSPRLAARDASVPVAVAFLPQPEATTAQPITEVDVTSAKQPAAAYASVKNAWEVLQDIGDCKLPRVGKRGEFPAVAQVLPGTDVITDTWEGEGVRVELVMRAAQDPTTPDLQYCAVLRATEISGATTARR